MDLRSRRNALGLSQSRLARLSGVSRFKVCLFELGDGSLKPEEQQSISTALRAETDRLRSLPTDVEFDQPDSATDTGGHGEISILRCGRTRQVRIYCGAAPRHSGSACSGLDGRSRTLSDGPARVDPTVAFPATQEGGRCLQIVGRRGHRIHVDVERRPGLYITARVRVGSNTGNATGESKAATITVAIARAIGLEVPDSPLAPERR